MKILSHTFTYYVTVAVSTKEKSYTVVYIVRKFNADIAHKYKSIHISAKIVYM